jgi:hypothetical protein
MKPAPRHFQQAARTSNVRRGAAATGRKRRRLALVAIVLVALVVLAAVQIAEAISHGWCWACG